jgi:hypothetical protein
MSDITEKVMRMPLIKLPIKVESALLLIREELKTRSFFNRLEHAGLLSDNIKSDVHALIAQNLGVDIGKDEDFSRFQKILEDASKEVEPDMDNEDLMMIVLRVYTQLAYEEVNQEVKA